MGFSPRWRPSVPVRRASYVALHNHLRDTLATKSFAADESLALDAGKEVADGGQGQEDTGGDQAGGVDDGAEELDDGHDGVGAGAHVVGRDLADEAIERGRGRADSEQQGDLNEEDDQRGSTRERLVSGAPDAGLKGELTWRRHRR